MSDVDAYISRVDPRLRAQFEKLRSLVKKGLPGASEAVKWHVPYYTYKGVGVASIAEYTDHVNLYLMQGAQLSSRLLEGTGKGMRHITVKASSKTNDAEILRLLRQAGGLAEARGKKKS